MAKDAYYFPHDYHSRHDRKLQNLFMDYGLIAIGAYWCIIEMLYEEGGKMPCEYGRIAMALRTEKDFIANLIVNYELFEEDGKHFWSNSVIKRLNNRKEKSIKATQSASKRWHKDATALRPECEGNAIKERKGKEIKGNNKHFSAPSLEEVEKYFKERNTKVDSKVFHAYYEANGWVQGKNKPIKNWKSCLTTWENNGFSNEVNKPTIQDPNKRYEETQKYLKSLEVAAEEKS